MCVCARVCVCTQIIGDSQDKDINDDEDEMHLEETDKYEAAYNFR